MNEITLKKIRNQYGKLIEENDKKDLFLEFCCLIDQDLNQYNNKQINLFHFYFQDIKYYFEHFGDKVIYELIDKVHNKIRTYISEKDNIYQWNLRSIMVACFSYPEAESLYKRFNEIEFDFNGIQLNYKLSSLNLEKQPKKIELIWKNFINQ